MYGRTDQYQTTAFDSTYLASTTFDRSVYYSGFTFTLGTIYEGIADLLNIQALHSFTIGVTLTTGCSLNADIQRTYSESSYISGDSTVTENGTSGIPLSLGLGLSYVYHNRYRFLGDLVAENWGNIKYVGLDTVGHRNSLRASLGFEALPEKDADTFVKRIVYRAGIAYNATYYEINGVGINEFTISGGLGLPMGPESQLNIGLQIGLRGSTDNHLEKDTIVRLSVAVSATEIWFLRFEEE